MKRHNSKERVGVYKVASVIEDKFNWIFREQPIADVGIDSLVEICENGEPLGKFIALQIKSGKKNFSQTAEGYTYYISNTHYYYWTNLDFPIIIVGYIPETDSIYWEEICIDKIKKTKKKWKITLPFNQKLEDSSYLQVFNITKLYKQRELKPNVNQESNLANKIASTEKIDLASESMKYINFIIENFHQSLKEIGNRMIDLNPILDYNEKVFEAHKIRIKLEAIFKIFSNRIIHEVRIYSLCNVESYIGFKEKSLLLFKFGGKESEKELIKLNSALITVVRGSDEAIRSFNTMKQSVLKLLIDDRLKISESNQTAIRALTLLINELKTSRSLWEELRMSIEELLKSLRAT